MGARNLIQTFFLSRKDISMKLTIDKRKEITAFVSMPEIATRVREKFDVYIHINAFPWILDPNTPSRAERKEFAGPDVKMLRNAGHSYADIIIMIKDLFGFTLTRKAIWEIMKDE